MVEKSFNRIIFFDNISFLVNFYYQLNNDLTIINNILTKNYSYKSNNNLSLNRYNKNGGFLAKVT